MRRLHLDLQPVLLSLLIMAGCAPGDDTVTLRLGHSLDTSHPVHQAMERMAEELHENSGGTIRLRIYPSSQLGSEREMIELVQLGALDMVKTSTAPLEGFIPEMAIFGVPYLFRDDAHYWEVLNGAIGRRLLDSGQGQRLKGLCYYDAGSRSFYTKSQPIRSPADLRGLKIRVQNSRMAFMMVEALGGAPTPISFGELYTALDQGVADGAENNPPSFLTSRHYEICKHYALDEHTRVPDIILISTATWNRLTAQARQWLQEAANISANFQRQLWREQSAEALSRIAEAGVEVSHPDKGPFQEAVRAIHRQFEGTELGNLITEIVGPASVRP